MQPSAHSFERTGQPREPVRLAWVDERGEVKCAAGKCIDVSSRRIHVQVRKLIPLHTRVLLRADGISLAGSASVSYATRCDDAFILVLDVS